MKNVNLINPLLLLFCLFAYSCNAQGGKPTQTAGGSGTAKVGGPCDGCDLMWVGIPVEIDATDTSQGWQGRGEKLVVKGQVFKVDGHTPAADIILYYWQTDNQGYYSPAPGLPEKARRHGHIRGWVKTDKEGRYTIYTLRPLPYPGETIPAHIHLVVKEPSISNEYYVDEIVFEDDPLLTGSRRAEVEHRGGSGVVLVKKSGSIQTADHRIVLGLNIPGYPKSAR